MPFRIVGSVDEPIIKETLAYLERKGIPASHIRAIRTDAELGQPVMVTVSILVSTEDAEPAHTLNHPGSDRWTGGDKREPAPEKLSGVCEPLDAADTGDAELAEIWKYRCDECDRAWPTATARDEYHGVRLLDHETPS